MAIKTHITKFEEGVTEQAVQFISSDPGSPSSGQFWFNTTDKELKYYDGSDINTITVQMLASDPGGAIDGDIWINTTSNELKYKSSGTIFAISGGSSGGAGGTDPLDFLLQYGEIANSAYASGLSVVESSNNTEEGYTISPETAVNFRGVSQFDTNVVLQIDTIGGSSVDCNDNRDKSALFPNTEVVQVFRKVLVDGEYYYINTGIEKTLTGASTYSAGVTTVNLDVTNLEVADLLYKKSQITHEISFVSIGAADSFTTMTKEGVQVIATSGGTLAGISRYWKLQEITDPLEEELLGETLELVGTATAGTGHHLAQSLSGLNGSNYVDNGTRQRLKSLLSSSFSLSFWFYTAVPTTGNTVLAGILERNTDNTSTQGFRIEHDGGGNFRFYKNGSNVSGDVALTNNTWYHMVVTHNSGTSQTYWYTNNTQRNMGTAALNNVSGTGGLALGSRGNGSNFYPSTSARWEDVQFYTTELTSGDVSTLYNSGAGLSDSIDECTVIERYTATSLTGQILKSKVTVPSISGTSTITVTNHGVIKES